MEPPPVLIAALEVHVCRGAEARSLFEHRGMTHTGIEPHIEYIRLLCKLIALTYRADRSWRQQIFRIPLEPDICSVFIDQIHHVPDDILRHEVTLAAAAGEHSNRYAPQSL